MTIAASTAAADVTGILMASVVAALGFLVIPARRRKAKAEMQEKISALRERLATALRTEFERAQEQSAARIGQAVDPTGASSARSRRAGAMRDAPWPRCATGPAPSAISSPRNRSAQPRCPKAVPICVVSAHAHNAAFFCGLGFDRFAPCAIVAHRLPTAFQARADYLPPRQRVSTSDAARPPPCSLSHGAHLLRLRRGRLLPGALRRISVSTLPLPLVFTEHMSIREVRGAERS